MIYDYVVQLIGIVPEGFEPAVYVFSGCVLLFLLLELFAFLHNIFRSLSEG